MMSSITNPTRLLSVSPFHLEDLARESAYNASFDLHYAIEHNLQSYKNIITHFPRPPKGHCSIRWEEEAYSQLEKAFMEVEDSVEQALRALEMVSNYAGILWECHGFDDDEHNEYISGLEKQNLLYVIRASFRRDLYCLSHPNDPNNDLPF